MVAISTGVRNALSSLQSVQSQSQVAQQHLATGRKVNSAVDNAVNYFTAAGLNDRSSQLSGLLDGMSNAVQTINAASKGIDGITKLVQSLQSTLKQAQADAATNRPTKSGTALTAAGDKNGALSVKDVVLNKALGGAAAVTADYTANPQVAGDLGGNFGANTALSISATDSTGNVTSFVSTSLTATSTVRDLVNEVNKSGIATASVDDTGKLVVTGTGSGTLKVGLGTGSGAATALSNAQSATLNSNATIGLALTDASAGISASSNSTVRSNLVKQFNDLRDQVDQMAKDAGFNGTNLLDGNKLSVVFNEKTGSAQNKMDVQGQTVTSANLGIQQMSNGASAGKTNIQDDTSLQAASDGLTSALSSLRGMASTFGSNLSVVQARQDFTKSMIDTLSTGADNLVNADQNQEAATLLALQTRQQLSQTSLSLSNQADQGILRLF
ncbi:flagellin [Alsobacter sp. KACC 23698]|uniref:Flagellin n=1 Tax=Alsobacter sp. KACC 23698 TaxID=3149229 RepID=A0AAU7JJ36_9HYPH